MGRNQSEDPSKDPQYVEPAVDAMRKQKDEVGRSCFRFVWVRAARAGGNSDGNYRWIDRAGRSSSGVVDGDGGGDCDVTYFSSCASQELERYRRQAERKAHEGSRDSMSGTKKGTR